MIGQRVILNRSEIGTLVAPERKDSPNTESRMWVFSPSRNYASQYDVCNIQPLPNGQL